MLQSISCRIRAGICALSLAAPLLPAAEGPEPARGPRRAGGGPEIAELKFRQPPPPVLSPAEALKTFKIAPGFTVELVASEPMIEAPVALSWDAQGRLFVCEMRGYMRDMDGAGEDQPLGRISLLEDTDGDGKMDRAASSPLARSQRGSSSLARPRQSRRCSPMRTE